MADSESAQSSPAIAAGPLRRHYLPAPSNVPTQEGPLGIRFDFNEGCRVFLPEGDWRLRFTDLGTGMPLYQTAVKAEWVVVSKRWFIRMRIEIHSGDTLVFQHDFDARDKEVLIQFPMETLGDTFGWLPYAAKFQKLHGCRLSCALTPRMIPLFRHRYPEIDFILPDAIDPERYYATYRLGLFFTDDDGNDQPCNFRHVGLHCTAGYILGVDPAETPPLISADPGGPPIDEPYVCIATKATTQAKHWNNPFGWSEIVAFLKLHGYRVVCIDREATSGGWIVWNQLPWGVEDQTGDRPLTERARWLKHAAFFVGLSSGLSWLAWAAGTPVVMISGFTHPTNEFHTPYRVINFAVCNSCWNDPKHLFDHSDFLWCPRHRGTDRQFECTRLIPAEAVKQAIQRIPGFGQHRPPKDTAGEDS